MKIKLAVCLLSLLASGIVLGQTTETPKGAPSTSKGEKKETKLAAPTKKQKELMESYGSTKEYCCQFGNSCISGPKDGSEVCKKLGGTPYHDSACVPKEPKGGKCIDP